MPRLGSNFFNAYNDQVDNLRRRRGENVEAFNSFVKMRTELGETASVTDMEKMRNSLAGGEGYFMNALPTGTMLQETNKRLIENQADERTKEAGRSINNRTSSLGNFQTELEIAKSITSSLVDVDLKEKDGLAKVKAAFTSAGQEKLFEQFEGLIPNIHESSRLSAVQNYIDASGFDLQQTAEGVDSSVGSAQTWMRGMLRTRGDNNVKTVNDAKIEDAKSDVIANFAGLINDAGGDEDSLKNVVKGELKYKLGPLYTDKIFDDLMVLASGQLQLDTSKRLGQAMQTLSFNKEELLGSQGNGDRMNQMATAALVQGGAPNPTPQAVADAVKQLKIQQRIAVREDFEGKITEAVRRAETLTKDELELMGEPDKIEDEVTAILKGVMPDYDDLSETQLAEARASVKAIIAPRAQRAVEGETLEDNQVVYAAIMTDQGILRLAKSGPSKEKMQSIYARINNLRHGVGLSALSEDALEEAYGDQIRAVMNVGASERYAEKSAQIRADATAIVADIQKDHTKNMGVIAGQLNSTDTQDGALWATVAQQVQMNFMPRSHAGYQGFTDMILVLQERGQQPPQTPAEAALIGRQLAQAAGWLPYGSAQQVLMAEQLSDADLIMPDTPVTEFIAEEESLVGADMATVVAQITTHPRDQIANGDLLRNEALEIIDDWEEGLKVDMNSPTLTPLLAGLNSGTAATHNQTISNIATRLRTQVIEAAPSGQYSFMTHLPGPNGGIFVVSNDASKRDAIQAANDGLRPMEQLLEAGASYRKIPSEDGSLPTYEKVLGAPITAGAEPVVAAGNSNAPGVTQVDTNASPLTQDVQALLADADIQRALQSTATGFATGEYGEIPTPIARAINYIWGNSDPDSASRRALNGDAMRFIRTPVAKAYLLQYPETITILKADPVAWYGFAVEGRPPPSPEPPE